MENLASFQVASLLFTGEQARNDGSNQIVGEINEINKGIGQETGK